MSGDNFAIVGQILYEVGAGLGPYVLNKYRRYYGDEYRQKLIDKVESPFSDVRPLLKDDDAILTAFDAYRWLRAIVKDKTVFRDELGPVSGRANRDFNHVNAFNFAYELLNARNVWAHANVRDQFENDAVFRIAENAVRLLVAVDAKIHAKVAENMMRSVGRKIYGTYSDESQRKLESTEQALEATSHKLESTVTELESQKRRLAAVEDELKLANVALESARMEADNSKHSLAQTSQRLLVKERELADTVRRLDSAEKALEDDAMARKKEQRAAPSAQRRDGQTTDGRALPESAGRQRARVDELLANAAGVKDFSGQNLAHAQLANTNLAAAILRDVDLSHANLANADLSNAVLIRSILRAANLSEARLQGADLTMANLEGATLRRARLMGAKLEGAILPDGQKWTPATNMGAFLR